MEVLDAAALISQLHGRLLRASSYYAGSHFQGLRAVASHMRRHKIGSPQLQKKLQCVDDAHSLVRHVTAVAASELLNEVERAFSTAYAYEVQDELQPQRMDQTGSYDHLGGSAIVSPAFPASSPSDEAQSKRGLLTTQAHGAECGSEGGTVDSWYIGDDGTSIASQTDLTLGRHDAPVVLL